MLCTIYRLRHRGVKLPTDKVKVTECVVDLEYKEPPGGMPVMRISLFGVEGPALSQDNAKIRIKGNGFMFSFLENCGAAEYLPQVWWCEPVADKPRSPNMRVWNLFKPGAAEPSV